MSADPLQKRAKSGVEWRIVWESGQETIGFTSQEEAEAVLRNEQGLIRGLLQVRGPWIDVASTAGEDE